MHWEQERESQRDRKGRKQECEKRGQLRDADRLLWPCIAVSLYLVPNNKALFFPLSSKLPFRALKLEHFYYELFLFILNIFLQTSANKTDPILCSELSVGS